MKRQGTRSQLSNIWSFCRMQIRKLWKSGRALEKVHGAEAPFLNAGLVLEPTEWASEVPQLVGGRATTPSSEFQLPAVFVTHRPAFLEPCSFLLAFLPFFLPTFLPSFLPSYLPSCLPDFTPSFIRKCLLICITTLHYEGRTQMSKAWSWTF